MDRLRAMEAFVRVVERGSFTRAAADLGLSHGMASAMVKALEAELKVALLHRTTRRLSLTEEGETYWRGARRLLDEMRDLDASVGDHGGRASGRLRVQVPPAFAATLLAPTMGAFRHAHPDLSITLIARDGLPDLAAERLDAAVFVGEAPAGGGLASHRLGRHPRVLTAAPSYLARRGTPTTIDDLAAHDRIAALSATTGRPLDWRFRVDGRPLDVAVDGAVAFEGAEAVLAATLAGAGLSMNVGFLVEPHVANGRLVRLLDEVADPGPDLWLVHPAAARPPARLAVFVDFVKKVAARIDPDRPRPARPDWPPGRDSNP